MGRLAGRLAAVLTGAQVFSATLELYLEHNGDNWGASGRSVEAHRLTADWSEAAATWACPADADPTNQQADCAIQWNGGSFAAAPTSSVLHTNGLGGWIDLDVTADLVASLAGTADYGWLLKKAEEGKSGLADYTSREGVSGQGPKLTVVFSTPESADTEPPALAITQPADGDFVALAQPQILAAYSDAGSGVDAASVRISLDGTDVTGAAGVSTTLLELTPATPLAEGPHTVTVTLSDYAGNPAQATASFTVDATPPQVVITSPPAAVSGEPSPPIAVSYSDAGAGIDAASVRVELDGADLTAGCTVGAASATCTPAPLAAGAHELLVEVRDTVGNRGQASLGFMLELDEAAPALAITEPASPLVVGDDRPAVHLAYADAGSGIDLASLHLLVDGADATAGCTAGAAEAVCTPPALARGMHQLAAQIADQAGNLAQTSLEISVVFPVAVAFTSPEPGTVSPMPVVRVTGTVAPAAVSVEVNGAPAVLAGGSFSIDALGLHDGANNLVAVARDAAGNVGTATLRMFADTSPPNLSITSPADGAFVSSPVATVTGLVNDLTIGTVSEAEITVTVDDLPAVVQNRSFMVSGITLAAGRNTLTARAVDRAGNQATVSVTYEPPTGRPSIAAVSGDAQTAPIFTPLAQPLVVAVSDAAGQPMAGAQVVFRVAQGSGTFAGSERIALVPTDAQGHAAVSWALGRRAGVGVDRVRATAVGVEGEAPFTALTTPGPAAEIHVAVGGNQRGAVAADLAQPLIAVVFDAGANPLEGVPVTFRSVAGGGTFGGATEVVVPTDESGLASAALTLGPSPGLDNHLVEATFPGQTGEVATFKASAFLPGDPAQTAIVGVVLDNQGDPVPGVTLRLRDSAQTTTADAQGQFHLDGVPVGRVFLIADATTTSRPGAWASLEIELFTVAGVENRLDRPVYILPLDLPGGVFVDETHGGTVALPDVPGFALDVAPGSVTFPGGSRSGVVSVTEVHADRIPMSPGAGMQPRLIVTIQPAGAHFDPPARLTLPNMDGLAPGTVTELFSFDHDLGAFVAIGTGTVTEDGRLLRSDPGFGILKAGWHCGSPPGGSGAAAPLQVHISTTPNPLPLCRDDHDQPIPKMIEAAGGPPRDAEYTWEISDGSVATLNPTGGGLCTDQPMCNTQATAGMPGRAMATVTITCKTTGRTAQDHIGLLVPGVEVQSADICGNEIHLRLLPEDPMIMGMLTLSMVGADGSHSQFFQQMRGGGTYTEHFDFATLPTRREFTMVEAVWHVGDCDARGMTAAHFMSLGTIRHTTYNCPSSADATCTGGGTVNACFTDDNNGISQCHYTGPEMLPGTWINVVTGAGRDTGCGTTPAHGDVKRDFFCPGAVPPGAACRGAAIFRDVAMTGGNCPGALGDNTVAVSAAMRQYAPCGASICILTGQAGVTKTVTDECPVCGLGRIDNFSTSTSCNVHDFNPSAVTLRLY